MSTRKFWMILPETGFDMNSSLHYGDAPRFVFDEQDKAEHEAELRSRKTGEPVYLLEAVRAFIPMKFNQDNELQIVPRWVEPLPF